MIGVIATNESVMELFVLIVSDILQIVHSVETHKST